MKAGRRELKKERMWGYFIDATVDVIEKEGIDQVTIRKVSDKAGFTSSTVYNYFQEFSHLIFFAAMRFTKDYIEELPIYINQGTNTIEKWLYIWECFCKHSFEKPEIYSTIFISNLGSVPEDLLENYYKTYQDDLIGLPEPIRIIVLEHTFSKRSALYLQEAVDEGLIEQRDVEFISDTTMLIWKGMMSTVLNHRRKYTTEEAIRQTLFYVYESVMKVVTSDKRKEINVEFNY
ncbi:TetR/AcrR family transcriptional regulator [Pseudalkalibacillus decolorationis]|uniref:TetR/AcrR family transcriptional regulator n=1 Tax=Pseudalkalibacillus decolorationis TaxID=163879 RepID=UPI0021490A78|nr:TetR/AcrR family transcriptional regulator [Pseudalkalibacillus decolorationis]